MLGWVSPAGYLFYVRYRDGLGYFIFCEMDDFEKKNEESDCDKYREMRFMQSLKGRSQS